MPITTANPNTTPVIRRGRPVFEAYGLPLNTQHRLIKQGRIRPPTKISPQIWIWKISELEQDLFNDQDQDQVENPQN